MYIKYIYTWLDEFRINLVLRARVWTCKRSPDGWEWIFSSSRYSQKIPWIFLEFLASFSRIFQEFFRRRKYEEQQVKLSKPKSPDLRAAIQSNDQGLVMKSKSADWPGFRSGCADPRVGTRVSARIFGLQTHRLASFKKPSSANFPSFFFSFFIFLFFLLFLEREGLTSL